MEKSWTLAASTLVMLCGCRAGTSVSPEAGGEEDAAVTSPDASVRDSAAPADRVLPRDSARDSTAADQKVFVFLPITCAPNVIFCEDFEAGRLNPATWTITGWGAGYGDGPIETTVTVETGQHAGGKSALHFKVVKPTSPTMVRQAFIKSKMTFGVGSQNLFVRYFARIDPVTPNRWMTSFAVREGDNSYGMQLLPVYETMPGPVTYFPWAGAQHPQLAETVPLGRWACWEYEFSNSTNGMRLTVDGNAVPGIDLQGGPVIAKAALYFGILNSHDDANLPKADGFNIWIDEIAVSTQKIGCSVP